MKHRLLKNSVLIPQGNKCTAFDSVRSLCEKRLCIFKSLNSSRIQVLNTNY